jgi:hypothetical protein
MSGYTPPGMITKTPEAFNRWLETNADRLSAAATKGTTPYFIRDNAKYTNPNYVPPEQRDELEATLGIKRGAPMSFEEANEMRGNPNYAKAVKYRINCQSTVVANELRRRGYDVEAYGNPNKEWYMPNELSKRPEIAFLTEKGSTPTLTRVKFNGDSVISSLQGEMAAPGRYHLQFRFANNNGHIVTAERLQNGTLRIYDPQRGKVITNFSEYTSGINPNSFTYYRVDNLRINPTVAKGVVKPAGTKGDAPRMSMPTITDFLGKGWLGESKPMRGFLGKPTKEQIGMREKAMESGAFPISNEHQHIQNIKTKDLYLGKKPLRRIINHCENVGEIDALKYIWHNMGTLRYRRTRALGDNKDLNVAKDSKNLQKKVDRGVVEYIEYEFDYNGATWLLGMERHRANFEQPYYIYKK